MIRVFEAEEGEKFDLLSEEDTKELLKQIIVRADGKSREFAENVVDYWWFNFQLTHFGYEKCAHTFGNWKITLQATRENYVE